MFICKIEINRMQIDFYYQSSREYIYIQMMENERKRKKGSFDKNRTQPLSTNNIQKREKEKMIRHTHTQADKNSICDFIECGFFVA